MIPSHASVEVDCRILPGQTGDDVRREVDAALAGIDGWEFAWTDLTSGNESPAPTQLSAGDRERHGRPRAGRRGRSPCISAASPTRAGSAKPSRDIVAYGFCPYVTEDTATMGGREHARDERIAVADVGLPGTLLRAARAGPARLMAERGDGDPTPAQPRDDRGVIAARPLSRRPARPRRRRRAGRSRRVPHRGPGARPLGRARRDGRRRLPRRPAPARPPTPPR